MREKTVWLPSLFSSPILSVFSFSPFSSLFSLHLAVTTLPSHPLSHRHRHRHRPPPVASPPPAAHTSATALMVTAVGRYRPERLSLWAPKHIVPKNRPDSPERMPEVQLCAGKAVSLSATAACGETERQRRPLAALCSQVAFLSGVTARPASPAEKVLPPPRDPKPACQACQHSCFARDSVLTLRSSLSSLGTSPRQHSPPTPTRRIAAATASPGVLLERRVKERQWKVKERQRRVKERQWKVKERQRRVNERQHPAALTAGVRRRSRLASPTISALLLEASTLGCCRYVEPRHATTIGHYSGSGRSRKGFAKGSGRSTKGSTIVTSGSGRSREGSANDP